MRIILPAFITLLLLTNCKSKKASKDDSTETKTDTSVVVNDTQSKETMLTTSTHEIMGILGKKDYAALAAHIHPVEGVRFSPYGYIDTAMHVLMSADAFSQEIAAPKQKVINWGEYDGTGDPIKMTLNDYLSRFVYGSDFSKPDTFRINTITNPGNAENNIQKVFPGSDFTDSHFNGFKKEYEGMDWESLRLVFRQHNGKYYLVGVIHDQWTI